MNRMWQARQPREKRLVVVALVFIVAYLFYQFGYLPVRTAWQQTQNQCSAQRHFIDWYNPRAKPIAYALAYKKTHTQTMSRSPAGIVGLLSQQQLNQYVSLHEVSAQAVHLRFSGAPFTKVMLFLVACDATHWHTVHLVIKKTNQPGRVNVVLGLQSDTPS